MLDVFDCRAQYQILPKYVYRCYIQRCIKWRMYHKHICPLCLCANLFSLVLWCVAREPVSARACLLQIYENIRENSARNYRRWIDVLKYHLYIVRPRAPASAGGGGRVRMMGLWKIWKLRSEKWFVCRSPFSTVEIKSSKTRREFTREFIYFEENRVRSALSRKSDPLLCPSLFFFRWYREPKIGLPARQCRFFVTTARGSPSVEITSFVMDPRSICARRA